MLVYQEAFSIYLQTKDSSVLPSIITQFENNRAGNKKPHDYIRETYFSSSSMQEMLNQIIDTIKGIEDKSLRYTNINAMGRLISTERKHFSDCMTQEGQTPGFNHEQYLQIFKEMKQLENEVQNR